MKIANMDLKLLTFVFIISSTPVWANIDKSGWQVTAYGGRENTTMSPSPFVLIGFSQCFNTVV